MSLYRTAFIVIIVAAVLAIGSSAGEGEAQGADGQYQGFGDAGGFLNILPPGQDGSLNGPEAILAQAGTYPPHVRDQLAMYGDLVYNTPGLTEERLLEFFKDASFGVKPEDIDRVYSPTPGVTIVRDKSFGVPHIFGETRYATMFAQGYATAEDRLFLMDALRHVGRARVSEFLGGSRVQPGARPRPAGGGAVQGGGPDGAAERGDRRLGPGRAGRSTPTCWPTSTASTSTSTRRCSTRRSCRPSTRRCSRCRCPGSRRTPSRSRRWSAGSSARAAAASCETTAGCEDLGATLGDPARARAVFDDLHFANDPEAPTTASGTFPYLTNLGPVDPAAHPSVDCASLQPVDDGATSVDDVLAAISDGLGTRTLDAPWGPITLSFTDAMSNALLVSGDRTANGQPIAVFGPQTAYFMPQLLVEKDVHGPGIDARGAAFAGTDIYVQLGRGRDYAWSATSASADNVDQFVLQALRAGRRPGDSRLARIRAERRLRADRALPAHPDRQAERGRAARRPRGPPAVVDGRAHRALRTGRGAGHAQGRHADRDRHPAHDLQQRAWLGARFPPHEQPGHHDRRLRVLPAGDGDGRGLHVQLVLHRLRRHRIPALVPLPAAGAGDRPLPAGVGHGTVRLAGVHHARAAAVRPEPGEGLSLELEQQAGARLEGERPPVLLRAGVPRPAAQPAD